MLTRLRIQLAFWCISAKSSSSRTNLASNCSLFCSYMLNSLVLLALEQVQRSCRSESSEIFRLMYSFGNASYYYPRTCSYYYIQKLSIPSTPHHYRNPHPAIYDAMPGGTAVDKEMEVGLIVRDRCGYNWMTATALLEVEGLPCRLIEELTYCERDQRVRGRFAGQIIKVNKDDKFASFIISDGSASAEVTLMHKRITTLELLPQRGDSVEIIGHGFRKVMGGKHEYSFLKILALSMSPITLEEELAINLEAAYSTSERVEEVQVAAKMEKAKPQRVYRTFETPTEQQEVRTLVLSYCYNVFDNNPDIQNYNISAEAIRCSHFGHEFMEQCGVTRDCLEEALNRTIASLSTAGILGERVADRGYTLYQVKRDLFKGIEKTMQERIVEMGSKGGVRIDQLSSFANKKIAEYANIGFQLFNWKFVQKLLTRMQADNKIYKTSEKLIFPNSRF